MWLKYYLLNYGEHSLLKVLWLFYAPSLCGIFGSSWKILLFGHVCFPQNLMGKIDFVCVLNCKVVLFVHRLMQLCCFGFLFTYCVCQYVFFSAAYPTSLLKWERKTPRERSGRPSTCGRPSRRSPSRSVLVSHVSSLTFYFSRVFYTPLWRHPLRSNNPIQSAKGAQRDLLSNIISKWNTIIDRQNPRALREFIPPPNPNVPSAEMSLRPNINIQDKNNRKMNQKTNFKNHNNWKFNIRF